MFRKKMPYGCPIEDKCPHSTIIVAAAFINHLRGKAEDIN